MYDLSRCCFRDSFVYRICQISVCGTPMTFLDNFLEVVIDPTYSPTCLWGRGCICGCFFSVNWSLDCYFAQTMKKKFSALPAEAGESAVRKYIVLVFSFPLKIRMKIYIMYCCSNNIFQIS